MSLVQGRAGSAIRRIWRQERSELRQVAARVGALGTGVGSLRRAVLGGSACSLPDALEHTVLPYLDWEEVIVFPTIERLAGNPRAGRRLVLELEQVRALIGVVLADWERLPGAPSARQLYRLRANLERLGVVLQAHLEREQRLLAPLLAPARA